MATKPPTHQLTLEDAVASLTEPGIFVPGHQHDQSCSITGSHDHNEWCHLSEAVWQVYRNRDDLFETGNVAVGLEEMALGRRKPAPALARQWLAEAEAKERDEIADVPNGPETLAAVAAALERMADR